MTSLTHQPFNPADIPVVILCGGMGTRLREASEKLPKPLVDVGGKPILWHVMKTYSHFGFRRFVLCLGYKGDYVSVEGSSSAPESIWVHTGKVGVRMVVGAPTILAQDRMGANTFTFVDLSAPAAYAEELDR